MKRTYRRALGGAAIDDIISHGSDPGRRGPWPRLIVAAIAVAVLAALIVQHLPSSKGHPHHRYHAGGRAVQGSPLVIRPARPDGVPGPTAKWTASLRLPVSGSRPAWLYPATGRTILIGGLPALRSGYVFTRIRGGWAVQATAGGGRSCAGCEARPLPVYFLGDNAGSARIIGLADGVAPAADPRAAWLTTFPSTQQNGDPGAVGYAQEFSVTGKPLGPRVRLPGGHLIDTATGRGLLLSSVSAHGSAPAYELWDPATRDVTRKFSAVIAASASHIAWTPRCAAQCFVRVLDVRTGRTTQIALARRGSAASGVFSPDGSRLALAVSRGNGGNGGATAIQLEVASFPGGQLKVVPGTWASSDALSGFGWPAGDDSLVAELSFMTKVQVVSWRPGSSRLAAVVVTPRQKPDALVVG
ncbi:MAG: hypothetical protein LBV34_12180 [Nocardiopsaceae bacterium]|nr:hypothetical protein [Nocardiopsaceae bacterium]